MCPLTLEIEVFWPTIFKFKFIEYQTHSRCLGNNSEQNRYRPLPKEPYLLLGERDSVNRKCIKEHVVIVGSARVG